MALVTLYPFVPIYILLEFKFGHFGNPLVFYSKWIYLASFLWLQMLDCPTLCPTQRMEVEVYYKKSRQRN
jgi:hypothetical protein